MNRSGHTYHRKPRRVRLWLHPETWALIDKAAHGLLWDDRAPTVIEGILETWANDQANWASRAATVRVQTLALPPTDLADREARADAWERSLGLDTDPLDGHDDVHVDLEKEGEPTW